MSCSRSTGKKRQNRRCDISLTAVSRALHGTSVTGRLSFLPVDEIIFNLAAAVARNYARVGVNDGPVSFSRIVYQSRVTDSCLDGLQYRQHPWLC